MALLSEADRQALTGQLAELSDPVRLVFFTQTFGCETCGTAREILDELASLSEKITIEEYNLVLDKDAAAEYGVDRAPAIVIVGSGGPRMTYLGAPSGYEFMSLVDAVRLASSGDSGLSEANRARVAAVTNPLEVLVYVTPT